MKLGYVSGFFLRLYKYYLPIFPQEAMENFVFPDNILLYNTTLICTLKVRVEFEIFETGAFIWEKAQSVCTNG